MQKLQSSHLLIYSSDAHGGQGWAGAKVGAWECNPGLPRERQELNYLGLQRWLSGLCISRKLESAGAGFQTQVLWQGMWAS